MAKKVYDAELQYLTVAFAKRIGRRLKGSIDSVEDPATSLAEAGLAPLLVYSLVAPAYSLYVRLLVDPSNPVPLSEFLRSAWSPQDELGMPLTLEVKKKLLAADRGFADWVRLQGITLKTVESTKSIDAFERASRDVFFEIACRVRHGDTHYLSVPSSLEACNRELQAYDRFSRGRCLHNLSAMERLNFEAWCQRDKHYCSSSSIAGDWDSSGVQFVESARPRPGFAVDPDDDEFWPVGVEGIKDLVAMWPGGRQTFFSGLNVSKRDFDFWASGRAHLAPDEFEEVARRANIVYCQEFEEWGLGSGYLLEASTVRQVADLYTTLSHGGDLEYAFELRGPAGELPPKRIAVFAACGGMANLLFFERGGRAERVLDSGHLINFGSPVRASAAVWDSALAIIANKDTWLEPWSVGQEFSERHSQWLAEQSRRYW